MDYLISKNCNTLIFYSLALLKDAYQPTLPKLVTFLDLLVIEDFVWKILSACNNLMMVKTERNDDFYANLCILLRYILLVGPPQAFNAVFDLGETFSENNVKFCV